MPGDLGAEIRAQVRHLLGDARGVVPTRAPCLKAPDDGGIELEPCDGRVSRLHYEDKGFIVALGLIHAIIVHEIAGAVQNRLALVELHPLEDVARVAEDDVRPRLDQRVGKGDMRRLGNIAPVRPPVRGHDEDVHQRAYMPHHLQQPLAPPVVGVHWRVKRPGFVPVRFPFAHVIRKRDHADSQVVMLDNDRPGGFSNVTPGTGMLNTGFVQ